MNKAAICFTDKGADIIRRINEAAKVSGVCEDPSEKAPYVTPYFGKKDSEVPDGFTALEVPLHDWCEERFAADDCIVFVGAVGIAVRAISDCVSDKLNDPPVIVIDDGGTYVIPILSGHAGGGTKISCVLASFLDAQPVITTSTDINDAFSADVFAVENKLSIDNRSGIKQVNAKAIEGKPVTLSIKDYPPDKPVDIIVADETDCEYSLLLKPKKYVLGLGMKKGTELRAIEEFVSSILAREHIETEDIYAVCTIDIKENEPGLKSFCSKYRLPLITFEATLLNKAPGTYDSSDFVREMTGTDNVCERAAMLGSENGQIIVHKTKGEGLTCAVALRRRYL
ncbi:MAG: cobalamin biosynthesis protein [Lachnospiraceae bacterium]|nr:cobalamin biosynthesis protein [Lachnospiraceae bacterium]